MTPSASLGSSFLDTTECLILRNTTGQRFVVDLTVWLDSDGASDSDNLAQTLDYSKLVNKVAGVVQGRTGGFNRNPGLPGLGRRLGF